MNETDLDDVPMVKTLWVIYVWKLSNSRIFVFFFWPQTRNNTSYTVQINYLLVNENTIVVFEKK